MRQYQEVTAQEKELEKIICNRCGKEIAVVGGVPREDTLSVSKRWGYFSNKDNVVDEFDLCEQCYDEIVEGFKIKIKR